MGLTMERDPSKFGTHTIISTAKGKTSFSSRNYGNFLLAIAFALMTDGMIDGEDAKILADLYEQWENEQNDSRDDQKAIELGGEYYKDHYGNTGKYNRMSSDKTIVMIFLDCIMMKIMMKMMMIKSEMRLILLLIVLSCTFCTRPNTKEDMLETYSALKTKDLSDFSWWAIIERSDRLMFVMYYEHKDSSFYQYTSSGSLLPMSKYRGISFYLNDDLDSLYMMNNDTTLQFDDGVEFLSNYSSKNINKLKSEIKYNYENFKRLRLKEVFGYPWANVYDFQLDQCIELKKVEGVNSNEDFLFKRGYIKLDSNWYYLIEAPCK